MQFCNIIIYSYHYPLDPKIAERVSNELSKDCIAHVQDGLNDQLTGPGGIVAFDTFRTYFGSNNRDEAVASARTLLGGSILNKAVLS